jgi:hypothetical protein
MMRRFAVWRETRRLIRKHRAQGYHAGAYQREFYRTIAERTVDFKRGTA